MKQIKLTHSLKLATVDDEDFERANKGKWCIHASRTGIVVVRYGGEYTPLANFILGDYAIMVDHINRNPLDNQKENLRACTHAENCRNQDKRKGDYSSPYKGVYLDRSRWRARITVDYKTIYLGYFKTEHQAALAYNEAAQKFHGEFASLNKV